MAFPIIQKIKMKTEKREETIIGRIVVSGIVCAKMGFLLAVLLAAAWFDFRKRLVPNKILGLLGTGRILFWVEEWRQEPDQFGVILVSDIRRAGLVLLLLMLFAWLGKGALGMGDVKLIGMLALFCSGTFLMQLLFYGLLPAAAVGAGLVLTRRKERGFSLPLVPFLFGGFLAVALKLAVGG